MISNSADIKVLVQLRVGDIAACLRRVFPADEWSGLRLVRNDCAVVAAALGLPEVGDEAETAVRIQDGAIRARAQGRGAAHAAAAAAVRGPTG